MDETRDFVGETLDRLGEAERLWSRMYNGPPYLEGPFLRRLVRAARLRGNPGGCGSGTVRTGRALRNSASMISGLVHRSGPHRAKRCSHNESSLVKRSTIRGAGPSNDAATVSSRATSSATQRRPLGSVYLAANARLLEVSMGSRVRSSRCRARRGPVNATQSRRYDTELIGAVSDTDHG